MSTQNTAGGAAPAASTKKKIRKNVLRGIVHVNATFNNTLVTISDMQGNTLAWGSAGGMGFKGSRKSTLFVV